MNTSPAFPWSVQIQMAASSRTATATIDVPPEVRAPAGEGSWKWMRIREFYSWRENNFYNTLAEWNLVKLNIDAPSVKFPYSVAGTTEVTYNDAILMNRLSNKSYGPVPWIPIENQYIPTKMVIKLETMAATASAFAGTALIIFEFSRDEVPPMSL